MQKPFANFLRGCLFGFSLLFVAGCVTTYPHSSPEALGKSVFKMMKKQDPKALSVLVATEADLEAFLASSDLPDEEKAYFKSEIGSIIEDYQGNCYNAYLQANDAMSAERILFAKSKLKELKVETWQGLDNMLSKIELDLESEGRKFKLIVNEAGEVKSGWVLGEKGFYVDLEGE